jgi:hypothetical protein
MLQLRQPRSFGMRTAEASSAWLRRLDVDIGFTRLATAPPEADSAEERLWAAEDSDSEVVELSEVPDPPPATSAADPTTTPVTARLRP